MLRVRLLAVGVGVRAIKSGVEALLDVPLLIADAATRRVDDGEELVPSRCVALARSADPARGGEIEGALPACDDLTGRRRERERGDNVDARVGVVRSAREAVARGEGVEGRGAAEVR